MFDKAVRGLQSQGFKCCGVPDTRSVGGFVCKYVNPEGTMHCAWGWVDTDLKDIGGTVAGLRLDGIGVAATLLPEDVVFASELQGAHDAAYVVGAKTTMQDNLRLLAWKYELTIPSDVNLNSLNPS